MTARPTASAKRVKLTPTPQVNGSSTDAAGWRRLREGLALADADVAMGRAELRQALTRFVAVGDGAGQLLAAAALVQNIGIADDNYDGFAEAVEAVVARAADAASITERADLLLARSGMLIAGWFSALDDPLLPALADSIVRDLANATIAAPTRVRAGLAALAFHEARVSLEDFLWVELAMRPVMADPTVGARLRDEWYHALVQGFYHCGTSERADALRTERAESGTALLPAMELKLQLLDAQMAIGDGRLEAGRGALARAAPLLGPHLPRPSGWWHLLRSRLHLVEGQHRDALIHARLSFRLAQESRVPARWMGVIVMQEGQVHIAAGRPGDAVPFFERAGRASSGSQADFCWCLVRFAQALADFAAGNSESARANLGAGFALARALHWLRFLNANRKVAASLCALALENGIEPDFVRQVIATRGLEADRSDLAAWPWPIRIVTLGPFRIESEGRDLAFRGKVAKKPLELLQFLIASSGSDVSASTVTFSLWRDLDGDNAKAALNVALHRLRKLLGNDEAIQLELGRLSLNGRLVWVDCLAFEQLVDSTDIAPTATLSSAAASAAERALALYNGPFLHDTDDHAWQLVCRTRLASKFKRMVSLLVRHAVARGDARAARSLLERALEFDPLAEEMARELMGILIDSGEQAAALAVFERCRHAIAEGLDAKPAPATLALLARLRPEPVTQGVGLPKRNR